MPSSPPPLRRLNSSCIFERSVEEPFPFEDVLPQAALPQNNDSQPILPQTNPQITSSPSNAQINPQPIPLSLSQPPPSQNASHRRTREDLVAPALDAGCSLVTDDATHLHDVDMVYPKRPSILGLNMALSASNIHSPSQSTCTSPDSSPIPFGRIKSYSFSNHSLSPTLSSANIDPMLSSPNPNNNNSSILPNNPALLSDSVVLSTQRPSNFLSTSPLSLPSTSPKTLKFLSYADVLSDELADTVPSHFPPTNYHYDMKRPSLPHSLSTSYIKVVPQSHTTPSTSPTSNAIQMNRFPHYENLRKNNNITSRRGKFHIGSTSSAEEDSTASAVDSSAIDDSSDEDIAPLHTNHRRVLTSPPLTLSNNHPSNLSHLKRILKNVATTNTSASESPTTDTSKNNSITTLTNDEAP